MGALPGHGLRDKRGVGMRGWATPSIVRTSRANAPPFFAAAPGHGRPRQSSLYTFSILQMPCRDELMWFPLPTPLSRYRQQDGLCLANGLAVAHLDTEDAPQNSGMRLERAEQAERACDCGRMANRRRLRSDVVRHHAAPGPGLTPQCPWFAMRHMRAGPRPAAAGPGPAGQSQVGCPGYGQRTDDERVLC